MRQPIFLYDKIKFQSFAEWKTNIFYKNNK